MKKLLILFYCIFVLSSGLLAQTKPFVPRANNEGAIGVLSLNWGFGHFRGLYADTLYWNTLSPAITSATIGLGNVPNVDATNPANVSWNSTYTSLSTAEKSSYVTGTPWTGMGYLTSYSETDPLVYAWAKASVKPSYTYTEVGAQAVLVSGTNIKTVNSNSLLGSGDIVISGSAAWGSISGTLSNQTDLNSALSGKQATLVSGTNIKTVNGNTLLGSGDIVISGGAVTIADLMTSVRGAPFIFTDFLAGAGAATVEAWMGLDYAVISSGTQAKVVSEANHPGILSTTSSTTTNSGGYCVSEATSRLISGGETFEIIFQHRVASGTNTTFRFGFLDNVTSADAVDGCYFEIPAASLNIVGKTASNSTRSTSSTVATITVNTWYRAKITVNAGATSVNFSLYNDAGTLLGSQDLTTNIPTGAGRNCGFGFVVTNVGTVATLLAYWDYMAMYYTGRTLTR